MGQLLSWIGIGLTSPKNKKRGKPNISASFF